jgi:hypothetical protein
MASNGPGSAPQRPARRRRTPPSPRSALRAAGLLAAATAALLANWQGAAGAATAPPAGVAAPCVFWGEAHACQSTDPHVTLEVINQHETSQCAFHESWTWGDGTPNGEASLTGSIEGSTQLLGTHTYTHPGTYKIGVTGYVLSEEPGLDFICEAPPVEYSFTLLPSSGVSGVQETRQSSAPPIVSGFAQSHRVWRAGTALARLAGSRGQRPSPVGTMFSFNLNEKAAVKLSFVREALGRRAGGRCAPATRRNRLRARCRLSSPVGALSFTAHPGQNRAYFDGRISLSQALTPASYGLTLTATNAAGQRSAPRSLHFTVLG